MRCKCVHDGENRLKSTSGWFYSCVGLLLTLVMGIRPVAAAFTRPVLRRRTCWAWSVASHALQHNQVQVTAMPQETRLRESNWIRLFSTHQQHGERHDDDHGTDPLSVKSDAFLHSIRDSLNRHVLSNLPPTTNEVVLLVGVSGGCDSVALLHALMRILIPSSGGYFLFPDSFLKCRVNVVHFDHKQRGAESDGDRLFVQKLCEKLRVPCLVYEWQPESTSTGFSQDAARQWRQSTMCTLLESWNATGVIRRITKMIPQKRSVLN